MLITNLGCSSWSVSGSVSWIVSGIVPGNVVTLETWSKDVMLIVELRSWVIGSALVEGFVNKTGRGRSRDQFHGRQCDNYSLDMSRQGSNRDPGMELYVRFYRQALQTRKCLLQLPPQSARDLDGMRPR
jgi:hypothetical protein